MFPFIRYGISDLLTGFSTYQSHNFPHCCKTEFPLFSWSGWHTWTAVNLYFLFKSDYNSSCQHASVHHACILGTRHSFHSCGRAQFFSLQVCHAKQKRDGRGLAGISANSCKLSLPSDSQGDTKTLLVFKFRFSWLTYNPQWAKGLKSSQSILNFRESARTGLSGRILQGGIQLRLMRASAGLMAF